MKPAGYGGYVGAQVHFDAQVCQAKTHVKRQLKPNRQISHIHEIYSCYEASKQKPGAHLDDHLAFSGRMGNIATVKTAKFDFKFFFVKLVNVATQKQMAEDREHKYSQHANKGKSKIKNVAWSFEFNLFDTEH
jgi:hypothetical protein